MCFADGTDWQLPITVYFCVCAEEDVCRRQSQSGQLADQHDVYEAAHHSGA